MSFFARRRQPIIQTDIPGMGPLDLVAYYEKFVAYYRNCEPQTKEWFVQNVEKDWVIFDCGANIGYFAIMFAKLAPEGKTYAFEPTHTVDLLNANLAHHGVTNVEVTKVALGKRKGFYKDNLYRIWGTRPESRSYDFTTIDAFVKERAITRLDCIKIDVDSFDFEVLQGAEQTLRDLNPYVMVELNHALSRRGQSDMEALHWLVKNGYTTAYNLDYDNFLLKRTEPAPAVANTLSIRFP